MGRRSYSRLITCPQKRFKLSVERSHTPMGSWLGNTGNFGAWGVQAGEGVEFAALGGGVVEVEEDVFRCLVTSTGVGGLMRIARRLQCHAALALLKLKKGCTN